MSRFQGRASCKYLTHKHASFHGCTVGEAFRIFWMFILGSVPFVIVLSLIFGHYLGGLFGGILVFSLVFFGMTYAATILTAKRVGKMRKGRAAGYFTLRIRQLLHEKLGLKIPYLIRKGKWSTRRKIR